MVRSSAMSPARAGAFAALAAATLLGCARQPACTFHADETAAPTLFEELGSHRRQVSTDSPEAQRYFDQGLVWAYAFNHDEAVRSFRHAAALDPECAMAHWGIALCSGPHINNPVMDAPRSEAAWDALAEARKHEDACTPIERALIAALAARYADPGAATPPMTFEERAPLDKAYAAAMRDVHRRFPDDPDVGVLFAESLMDTRPWDLWDGTTGEARPETPEILAALEHVLDTHPDHPGANHLYIHAVEASPHPEKAAAAADRLRSPLVPASGHLVHMPAHIDVRTGRWAEAAEQNRRAAAADAAYRKRSPRQGFYRVYMAHNDHFRSYACMMLGRRDESLSAARSMLANIPPEWLKQNATLVDGYTPIEIEALVRFGRWDEILELERPPEFLPITTAFWRFARATAYNATGELRSAEREQQAFRRAVDAVPEHALMAINPAHKVLSIADHTLAGELAFRRGDTDEAVSHLREAVAIEDSLQYMEPPDWIQPTRHALGAVLLASDRAGEAEQVYRDDLARWPENGWSLFGLSQCLKKRNAPEAAAVKARFERAWAHADTTPHATCLCVPKN